MTEYGFLCVSVGDCKAYHCTNVADRDMIELIDITNGNRGSAQAANCGGRIGPYKGNGDPDLDNLSLFFKPCKKGEEDFFFDRSDSGF